MADELLQAFERNCRVDTCKRRGHKWEHIGETLCGCSLGACRVPLHICRCCDVSDYGKNDDAEMIKQACGAENK